MRNRRSFNKKFKKNLLKQIISGGTTTAAASRKYSIAYAVQESNQTTRKRRIPYKP